MIKIDIFIITDQMDSCDSKINRDIDIVSAAKEANYGRVKKLLKNSQLNVNFKNKKGKAALITAARKGNFSIVKLLLDDPRVDTNLIDRTSHTALTVATIGNTDIVEHLLMYG